ncbi:MAG: FMN-binding protein [Tissierellia bacterium]|nr:FMN-binding protein [Tissierellia bacterium]
MFKEKSPIYPVLFILILTVILTTILAFLDQVTEPVIAFNQELELKEKILNVFDLYDENMDDEEINRFFDEHVTKEDYKDEVLYILEENGETMAYAVPFEGPGLWGSIKGYLGLSGDLQEITGVEFIKQDETPGLGGRISEAPYKEQYRGLSVESPEDGAIVINKPAPGGNIDAIAGATQTSTFVTNMINEDVTAFIEERKGE